MITAITQTITLLSTFPNRANYTDSNTYAISVSTWLEEQKNNYPELNELINQLNTFKDETNSTASTVQSLADAVQAVADTVNYKGNWSAGQYQVGESVTYSDGIDYLSKINNNTDEPPSANWKPLGGGNNTSTALIYAGL